jgi:hypothetical protein
MGLHICSIRLGFELIGTACGTFTQLAEVLQGVEAGIVAVAPGDLIGVIADRRESYGCQRHKLLGLENAERVRRFQAVLAAAGAGALIAKVLPGVDAMMAVLPVDDQTIGALFSERDWLRRF